MIQTGWDTVALVGIGTYSLCLFGPALTVNGLRYIIRNRRVYNTPLSKIGSAAIGDIALEGQSGSSTLLHGPVSGEPCCWWRCWVNPGAKNAPPPIESHAWFYIKDETGHILIDPASGGRFPFVKTVTNDDNIVSRFALQYSVALPRALYYVVREERLPPDAPLYLYAGLGRGRNQTDGQEVMMAVRPQAGTYLLCGGNQKTLEERLKMEGMPLVILGFILMIAGTWMTLRLPLPIFVAPLVDAISVFLGFCLPLEDPGQIITTTL